MNTVTKLLGRWGPMTRTTEAEATVTTRIVRWDEVRNGDRALFAGGLFAVESIRAESRDAVRVFFRGWTLSRVLPASKRTAVQRTLTGDDCQVMPAAQAAAELARLRARCRMLEDRCGILAGQDR